ncbi:15364_t:CDS:1 [Dentiscutata heterogama]|uniref:15364_t:CDS:1 n=1 Tax=Dentiscutata heterogama TaxID=1316150 RepID=A0ACA9M238_9GLOM|nr:15364_t:CDS:1 [Dentiscutata heterogama]
MDSNELPESSEKFNNSHDSSLPVDPEDLILASGPYGPFLDHGSSANCFCDKCDGHHIPLYTCRGENCKIKCPPHTRKCSKCADHNYSIRHRINRKYYANLKSRLNSENFISFRKSLIDNSENSISYEKSLINNSEKFISSEMSLINKSSDFVVDKGLSEIWNKFWSEFLNNS